MKITAKQIRAKLALLIALVMIFETIPFGNASHGNTVYADEQPLIYRIHASEGNWLEYMKGDIRTNLKGVIRAAAPGDTVGILGDMCIPENLIVQDKGNLNLELNGHKLFRNLSDYESDGGVINVINCTLTVYGGRQGYTIDTVNKNTNGDPVIKWDSDPFVSRIDGKYYDSNGWSQTSGTPSTHTPSTHTVDSLWYYSSGVKKTSGTFTGGVISGGYNNSGAGAVQIIYKKSGLKLVDTTVAGNRNDTNCGGAVRMCDKYQTVELISSNICYNYAYDDGGAIHMNADYGKLYLTNSHIDYNIADDNGGGISIAGDDCMILGDAKNLFPGHSASTYPKEALESDPEYPSQWNTPDTLSPYYNDTHSPFTNSTYVVNGPVNKDVMSTAGHKSTIAYNIVHDSDASGGGGGIYADGKGASMGGLNILRNLCIKADDSRTVMGTRGQSGAIHMNDESQTVNSCNIWGNWAYSDAGAIYCDNDANSVTDVTITENYSNETSRSGGGIFVVDSVNMNLGGVSIIKDNKSQDATDDNVFLDCGATMDARVYLDGLAWGSEVWLTDEDNDDDYPVSKRKGTYDERLVRSDRSDQHIEFKDHLLKIVKGKSNDSYLENKYAYNKGSFSFKNGSDLSKRTIGTDKTFTGSSGKSYPLYQGLVHFPSFNDPSKDITSTFFYSDGYFDGEPKTYNTHLATMSLHLALAGFYSNQGNEDGNFYNEDGNGTWYVDKSRNIRQLFSDLGVSDDNIYLNDYYVQKPGTDTIGVAIGSKDITV
nr:hypothetical protein [Lachnospiraceae bacterium]